ncbi:hypothetical protein FTO68_01905 [Methanocalculus taiwanensis]|uniref:Dockerin domain-containing protein n=1 Tax=Methanocalculus taiwanensis TaxID=106207 RepID=A0ABD4TFI9_9EURY|nr:cohesin domain-containing protein [Methanocalculus taiwanensis]MCQ1537747.1 hypothetical protein [Methanocalculus taiwanensis]
MMIGKKTIALILIFSCLIGIAFAGTGGEEVEAGIPTGTLFSTTDEETGFDDLEQADPDVLTAGDDQAELNFEALVQQNADSKLALGSVTVEGGQNAEILVSVANLTGATGIGFDVMFDPTVLGVENVTATPQAPVNTSVTWHVETYHFHEGFLRVSMTHDSLTVGQTPLAVAKITFNTTRVDEEVTRELWPQGEWSATEFDPVPFRYSVPGTVTITPPPPPVLPDLTGVLDPAPPQFVKKYQNGSIFLDPTFVIRNIGLAPVTESEDFDVDVFFVGQKGSWTLTERIDAGSNFTLKTDASIYNDSRPIEVRQRGRIPGVETTLVIEAGADISIGLKEIAIHINPDRRVEEIRYDNNNLSTQVTLTYPDLQPVLDTELIQGISSSETVIHENVLPGTHRVTYGVENDGGVFSVPTYLRVARDGVNTFYSIPALQPGENWTQSETITLDKTKGTKTYSVEVNSYGPAQEEPTERILHPDQGQLSKTITSDYASFKPVTVVFDHITGAVGDTKVLPVTLTNVSTGAPVRSFSIPVTYDPAVCIYQGAINIAPGVSVTNPGYGRLLVTGTNVNYNFNIKVADLQFRAQSEAGRTSEFGSTAAANVKTDDGKFLELDIWKGSFTQDRVTNARVSIWAPTSSPVDGNVSVSVTVWNSKPTPVNVSANVTEGGTVLWQQDEIVLGAYQSRYYSFNTWKPATTGSKTLTATISGDDDPTGNVATTRVLINPYVLDITNFNKNNWEAYYKYNRTVVVDNYVNLGTYYTTNMPGYINATLSMWYQNGTKIDLTQNSPFQMYYWYPADWSVYGYNSNWNSAIWYYILAREIGTFDYSIELEAKGNLTYVNGTVVVREPNVDIKVLESTTLDENDAGGNIQFNVFNRVPFEGRQVTVTTSAGSEGRTLQGLEYLVGYPHGCPEQTMSPALAALRVKQYYENRGKLTDSLNASLKSTMQRAYNQMKAPTGYNAQKIWGTYTEDHQHYGAWAWGQMSSPSLFYTLYPNYVFSELKHDMQQSDFDWGIYLNNTTEINLTASTLWLIDQQKADGGWQDWGYISNRYEWTGFMSEKFCGEFEFIGSDSAKEQVNTSLNKSFEFLESGSYNSQPAKAVAYGIFGLDAIKEHYKENATLGARADTKMQDLVDRLFTLRQGDGTTGYYWSDGWYDNSETTALAIFALNKTGIPVENETVMGGIRYLVSQYDTNGRWGNTRASAAVINTLTQLQIPSQVNFTANIGVYLNDDTVIVAPQQFTFDEDNVRHSFQLDANQILALYGNAVANRTGKIVITGKSDAGTDNVSKMVIAVQSVQKIPKSIAIASIPEEYIDPIATDFFLGVTVPAQPAPGLKVGDEVDAVFTVSNNGPGARDQTVMILEVPIGNGVNFTGADNAANKAYYLSDPQNPASKVFLTHKMNRTTGKLFVYPGSDNESQPSIVANEVKNFFVPLKFEQPGSQTVEARLYPMYDDEWMALGDTTGYVKGNGTIQLEVVNETGAAVNADFYIDGVQVAANINATQQDRLEGDHSVSIRPVNPGEWINTTLTVTQGEVIEYSVVVAEDSSLPHFTTIMGAASDARMMPPEVEETISNTSTNHWNAEVRAEQSFNSTISSTGGRATISVDLPSITRTIGTAYVNDTVTYSYRNATGWHGPFNAAGYISGGILTISDVNTADVTQVAFGFYGRQLGDVNNDGFVRGSDARDIAWFVAGSLSLTFNDQFNGDVTDDGQVLGSDARDIAWYVAGSLNRYYQ